MECPPDCLPKASQAVNTSLMARVRLVTSPLYVRCSVALYLGSTLLAVFSFISGSFANASARLAYLVGLTSFKRAKCMASPITFWPFLRTNLASSVAFLAPANCMVPRIAAIRCTSVSTRFSPGTSSPFQRIMSEVGSLYKTCCVVPTLNAA